MIIYGKEWIQNITYLDLSEGFGDGYVQKSAQERREEEEEVEPKPRPY